MTEAIRFDGVHRRFADHEVLRGLDLTVAQGEIFALLGRNGAGKTTALRILLGMLKPHAGTASIVGRDSAHLTPGDRARIAYVGEGHKLYATMRVRHAVDFEAGTRPGYRTDLVRRAIDRCGIRATQRIGSLSRGQRAQLALVLSIGTEPEVLIFDDPALGLDAAMRRELLDALIDLLSELGCAVLFSSHHLHDVERIADRIGVLHEGHLVVDARVDDLKRRVERRAWTPGDANSAAPAGTGVLRAVKRHDGYDLTLVDCDADRRAALEATGVLGEPSALSLEELFLDLTAEPRRGIFEAADLAAGSTA